MDPSRNKGKLQLILVVAFVLGAFGISELLQTTYEPPGEKKSAQREFIVETETVQVKSHRVLFTTSGLVQARNEIKIVPEATGRVIRVHDAFYNGGTFAAGSVLFEIDPRDYQQAVAQRQADVERLQAGLELAQAEVNTAAADWKRVNGNKPIPPLVAKEPQLKQAKANLQSAKAQLESAKLNLERTRFSLPFSGRVINSSIAVGQHIVAGQAYGEVFDNNTLEVVASLQDEHLEWLLGSDNPDVTFTGTYLGRTFSYKGVLKRSASMLDPNTRFATIRFDFAESAVDILPGVFTNITILGEELDNVMVLPQSAMQARGIVWLEKDGTLTSWKPEVIYTSTDQIIVKALADSANVVTSRLAGGTEGMQVKVATKTARLGDEANHE